MKNTIKNINSTAGFTLIEVMITLGILLIISSIAIPAYNGYIKTAKMSEANYNLGALRLAQEEFFLENNRYFYGNTILELESESGGLWTATKGSDNVISFNYVIIASDGWTATATGNIPGTSIYNEEVEVSR